MIRSLLRIPILCAMVLAAAGISPARAAGTTAKAAVPAYSLKGDYFEGCECKSVCACIWSEDATFDQCRGLSAWRITDGHYGSTDLKGVQFAAAITRSAKNMDKSMGKWEGVMFLPKSATPAQRDAIAAIMKNEMGAAFAKMDTRMVPVTISGAPGHQELTVAGVGHLKIAALKGANGKVPKIENPTSPLANPVNYLARSEVNSFNDGVSKWDFAGRNSYFGPFEMKHQ